MKNSIFLICMLLTFYGGFAQVNVSSVIVDGKNEPLQFVNISVNSTVKGTYTSKSGAFSLGGLKESDTLKISSIGYETNILLVNQISDTIRLEELATTLQEVEIKAEYQYEQIGIKKCKIQPKGYGDLLGWITGIVLKEVPGGYLDNVEVYVRRPEQNPRNQFLLRVYTINPVSGYPETSLLNVPLEITSSKRGWVKLDMSDYKIRVKNTLFIGVENTPNYNYEGELALDSVGLANTKEDLAKIGIGRIKDNDLLSYCWGRPQVEWQILNFEDSFYRGFDFVPMIRATVRY